MKRRKKCCICKNPLLMRAGQTPDGKEIVYVDSRSADPIADGECCPACDVEFVMAARMKQMEKRGAE
jgi:hypothetical protein